MYIGKNLACSVAYALWKVSLHCTVCPWFNGALNSLSAIQYQEGWVALTFILFVNVVVLS